MNNNFIIVFVICFIMIILIITLLPSTQKSKDWERISPNIARSLSPHFIVDDTQIIYRPITPKFYYSGLGEYLGAMRIQHGNAIHIYTNINEGYEIDVYSYPSFDPIGASCHNKNVIISYPGEYPKNLTGFDHILLPPESYFIIFLRDFRVHYQ